MGNFHLHADFVAPRILKMRRWAARALSHA